MRRWSKFKKRIQNILNEDTEIFCEVYRMQSQRGSTNLPHLYVTVNKQVVWEFPKPGSDGQSIYEGKVTQLNKLIELYLNESRSMIRRLVVQDPTGLLGILHQHDRRFHPLEKKENPC